jgi:hypothetical protein
MKIIPNHQIARSDLFVDAVYEGGATSKSVSSDALSKLLPGVGNQGGFRASGRGEDKRLAVLYTSGEDKDWPDQITTASGQFVYFGDNKTPGHELHDTQRGGNRLLRRAFDLLHASPPEREKIPPFLIFAKYPTAASARSVQFKGLAVPGFPGMPPIEDLVAVWKTAAGQRFQNYRAVFTILDIAVVHRRWIDAILSDQDHRPYQPSALSRWIASASYAPLASEPTTIIRTTKEQTPEPGIKTQLLMTIYENFKESPHAFESFAAKLFQMHDSRVIVDQVTRNAVDGGRDAIGRYLIGIADDPIHVEFSLEAKCYAPPVEGMTGNLVGVREVSRLISRIRNRQFGVLVTTSAIARQAYQEVREDRHPIVFLSGGDIVNILIKAGYNTLSLLRDLLASEFRDPSVPMAGGR